VYLAADFTPEFDSFKERLLELAQIRSVDELLRRVVTRLTEADPSKLEAGQPMRLVAEDLPGDLVAWAFSPADTSFAPEDAA
jgi:hypothetical protein